MYSITNKSTMFMVVCAVALFLLMLAPRPASAAAAATIASASATSTNSASSTLASPNQTVYFQLNLSGAVSATNTPMINVLGMGSTTMTGTAGSANWTYSTSSSSAWPDASPITFTAAWTGPSGEATSSASTFVSSASTTFVHVRFDKTVPTLPSVLVYSSNSASSTLAKADDIITLYASSSEAISAPTITAGGSATVSMLTASTSWKAVYTVLSGDSDGVEAISIAFADLAGNSGTTVTTATSTRVTIDNTAPVITITGSNPDSVVSSATASYTDPGATATDAHDGSTSVSVSSNNVTPTVPGSYSIVYSSTDTVGNTRTSTRTVNATVPDSGGPVVIGGGGGGGGYAFGTPIVPGGTSGNGSTIAGLQAQIQALLAQIAALGGSLSGGSFTRDLQLGSTGTDVKTLQVWLNGHGFAVASTGAGSPGNETTKFGALTRSALAKWQAAVGISPAAGYFGPKTRAYLAAHP